MGWKAAFAVRVSGLEDGTLVDVLESIAVFVNDRDMDAECYPALASVMTLARKSRNVVRASIKTLVEMKLLDYRQELGEKRYYRIHFDRLPASQLGGFRNEHGEGSEVNPVQKCTGSESDPGSEVTPEGVQNCTRGGVRSEPGEGSEVNPEKSIEKSTEKRNEERSSSARASAPNTQAGFTELDPPFDEALFELAAQGPDPDAGMPIVEDLAEEAKPQKPEKPKRKRAASTAVTEKPADISQEVWDDWLTARRAKRLPLTQTALNAVRREAASAGLTFQAAVTFAVEQGWAAFRAEWYRNATRKNSQSSANPRYMTAEERYQERIRISSQMSDDEYLAQFQYPNLTENKTHAEA